MKIKSIQLHPFAGIQNKTISLSDGLNLILGPNEAGKSTIFKAIQHGLLTSTSLTAGQLKSELGDLFPLGGGDVIRLTLEIYVNDSDEVFTIKKVWKPGTRNGSASFTKPDGNEFTEDERVQEKIEELLTVKPATMKQILLSQQSALHTSLDSVKNSTHVRQDIGSILRKSVMETGGVSIDKFKAHLDSHYDELFANWNRERKYPLTDASGNDRGIHNPHRRSVGKLLTAWYEKERERDKFDRIHEYEDNLDKINKGKGVLHQKLHEKKKSYGELKPKLVQQQQRAILEERIQNVQTKLDEVSKIAEQWPVYEYQLKESEPKLKTLNVMLAELNEEQQNASKKSEIDALQKRLVKLEKIDQQIIEVKNDIDESVMVTESEVEKIRILTQKITTKQARLEASHLTVKIHAKQNTEFAITDSKGVKQDKKITQGETKSITQDGVFSLETETLQISVTAGEEDLSSITEEITELQSRVNKALRKFDAKDFSELNTLQKVHEGNVSRLEVLKEQKKEELGEDEPEFLKEQLTKAGELSEVRDLKIIQQERDRILEDKSSLKSKVDEMKTAIHKWEKEYSDKNGLFGKRAEFTSKMTELYKELSQNEELPEDFETLESFNQYVDQLFAEIEELREQKQQLEIEVAEKEGKAPDISSEEQKSIMEEAKAEFDKVHTKAESLARVKDRTDALLADLEQQTYTPLTEGIIKWLGIMSDGRFNNITLDEEGKEIPSTFVTSDDQEIPFHLLSHGTKDLTALAWKLTVTEKFLKDQSSLILLDDPMVDMDPERKKMAGKALIEFAEQQQVILFSCHPEMEEILNNNLNTLEI